MSGINGLDMGLDILLSLLMGGTLLSNMKHGGGVKSLEDPKIREEIIKTSDQLAKAFLQKGDEARGEMIAFISSLPDDYASVNLHRRHLDRMKCKNKTYPNKDVNRNEKYLIGSEDLFSDVLTKLFVAMNGSEKSTQDEANLEKEMREEIFINLGNMNDEEFDSSLEMLYQRPAIVNYIRKMIAYWPTIKQDLARLDAYGSSKVMHFRQELEKNELIYTGLGERNLGLTRKFIRWIGSF